ncbi:MAG: hypothetical protein DHS20C13_30460 [Thermodesulfobacteriota bacterium]|nr:MAG: hypothetical protein DHS20C13_30460 [Thermodesulfobacteriota bacterium]
MNLGSRITMLYIEAIRRTRLLVIFVLSKLLFKQQGHCKKILINRDGAFGDSIVALPAINLIRQSFPTAQIDLLSVNNGSVSFKDLGLQEGLIDSLYVVNKKERSKTLKSLKQSSYDLFIQIPQNIGIYKSIRNMLLVRYYLNIQSAFGWDSGRIKSLMRYQKHFLKIPTETQRFINTLEKNGIHGNIDYPLLSQEPKQSILEQDVATHEPIVFLIGGKLQPKKWPLENWVTLAELIGSQEKILLIGGRDETDEAEFILSKTANTINLCGELTIPELNHVFKNTKLAIGLDTGAMHLCDAAGTKLIALFSTRDLSNKWYPNNKNSIVIEKVLSCSFCLKTKCSNNICMSNIKPEEVYSCIEKLLAC